MYLIIDLLTHRNIKQTPFGAVPVKGTVSPDITFYFRFCKIKSVLSVRPLRVFKFFYFVVL
jgi:hypothetical protein